mgnify:CR=1 FL=1
MKKLVLSTLLLAFMVSSNLFGQSYMSTINKFEISKNVPVRAVEAPDRAQLAEEDALRDKQGLLYRIAVARLMLPAPSTLPASTRFESMPQSMPDAAMA